MSNKY